MRPALHKQKGFTLTELMVVMAVIGLLASVALPKYARLVEIGREGATKESFRGLKSAIAIYYSDNIGIWPETIDPADGNFVPDYIAKIPEVKVTGNNIYKPAIFVSPQGTQVTVGPLVAGEMDNNITGVGWRYDPNTGRVWVNSSLKDSKGVEYYRMGLDGNWYDR